MLHWSQGLILSGCYDFDRIALRLAKEVADETGTLMAGNICNTGAFDPENPETVEKTRLVFKVCLIFTTFY